MSHPIRNIIGSGIFVSPKGVLENAGSVGMALIVWIVTGVITAVGALCYAELGVTIPKSGGDYSYVKDIFGGLAGFLRLWIAVLVIYPTNQAVIALTFSNYVLQPLFPTCFAPESGLRLLAAVCLFSLAYKKADKYACAGARCRGAMNQQEGSIARRLEAQDPDLRHPSDWTALLGKPRKQWLYFISAKTADRFPLTWASTTPQQCHRLIASIPRCINAMIDAKGAPTKC
ncbi:unnamed protein product [Ranitomeya imitator]|uniref:Uncharacterized protein n=1 Tax=Ranitomeya imitator TaxID=111125 RepID=A0ABN9M8W7_9NEOB|nr:unnamed protein product [Ranitomeya imitator]